MLFRIVAAGTRMPSWVQQGFDDYAQRLRGDYRMELTEIALGQRSGTDVQAAIRKEGERMLAATKDAGCIVALQVHGKPLSSEALADFIRRQSHVREMAFCIGGPDGLAPDIDQKSQLRWSLSALTLPHAIARVVVAEALYRAVTIIKGHPYHRA